MTSDIVERTDVASGTQAMGEMTGMTRTTTFCSTSSLRRIVLSSIVALMLLPGVLPAQGAQDSPPETTEEAPTPEQQPQEAPEEGPATAYPSVDRRELIAKLESDRLLLAQVRKQVPQTREEAELYLSRLKRLASHSDPVRLVPLANRVLDQSVIYYDWLEREFENPGERVVEYYIGGARGFHIAVEEFKSAAMFTVINRLDVTVGILTELESQSGPTAENVPE
jgi:hypothetical protein